MRMPWNPEEDEIIRQFYPTLKLEEITVLLPNRTLNAIGQRAAKLKVLRPREFQFTEEQEKYLIINFPTTTDFKLCLEIGCSINSLRNKCRKLGLIKDPNYVLESNRQLGKKLADIGAGNRFQKGHIPPNKGKRVEEFMAPDTLEKFKKNQFTKGQRSRNWLPVGSEVVRDGYVMVKLAEGMFQYELKHRIVWEIHHGPIPKGYNVQFKDRNPMNCELKNLYLISNQDQVRQNSIHNYPVELKKAFRLIGKLNKQIKNHETNKS